jgi:hypothetical protein
MSTDQANPKETKTMDRAQAIEAAQAHLIRVLEDAKLRDINIGRDNDDLYDLLNDVRSAADEMKSLGARMQRDIAAAMEYVSGKPASFNSLGILQADGPRFDALAMKFDLLSRMAKKQLVRYYMEQAA